MEDLAQEAFFVIGLNTRNRITVIHQVAMGCPDAVSLNPGDIAKVLLLSNSTGCIVSHNHCAGSVEPSPEDRALTNRIREIMQLLSIRFLDHLIIGENRFFSFQEAGMF
jgi:DNA repair protein RadC